jgi:secreted trypsin-like serine protease
MTRRILTMLLVILVVPLYGQFFETRLDHQVEESQEKPLEKPPIDDAFPTGPTLGRIVGGQNANIQDYPWQVALMTSSGQQFCGGVIIHPEWVITAAHCLGGTIYIRAGVTNRTHTTGQDRLVIAQHGHPNYGGSNHQNDIAMLKLQTPLDLSGPNVKAIPIVTAAHAELGYTEPGVLSKITGWGALYWQGPSSNILQVATVPITTMEYAQTAYPGVNITPDMLPAGYPEGGVDACQGDSGGPLVVPAADSPLGYRVAGLTTWGQGCAWPGLPGMYARVSHFEQWLSQTSGIVFEQPSGLFNPTQFTAEAASTTQIDLSWNKNADNNNVMLVYSTIGAFGTPQDGTTYSPGQTIPGGGIVLFRGANTTFSHTGLQPATRYYYKAFSYNAANEYSIGTTTNETTLCDILTTLPLTENFNASTSLPVCWEIVDNVGNGQVWQIGTFSGGLTGTTGNYAYLNSDGFGSGNTQNSDLVTPLMDLSNYSNISLTFKHYFRAWSGSSATLQYSINGGQTWNTIQTWTSNTANPATFTQALPALASQASVLIRWKYQGTWGYSWSVDDISLTGTYTPPAAVQVSVKAALEGAVNHAGSPLMNTSINNLLPLNQPYNPSLPYYGNPNPGWLYNGNESVATMPANVVDWVVVELRDAPSATQAVAATAVGRKAGLLRNNGMITNTINEPLSFDIVPQHNLYVVVYHRNHLAVMSAQALSLSAGVYSYDFTNAATKAYGGANAHKQVIPGVWALFGGDGDANGQIQSQDKNDVWESQTGLSGYYPADFDMNGQVQTQDKNNIWEKNSGIGSAVP